MKQSEKLDLILKYLYKYKYDKQWHDVKVIMQSLQIYDNEEESVSLVNRLIKDHLVDPENGGVTFGFKRYSLIKINSHGIDYCENNSHSKLGSSIINNNYNTFNVNENSNVNYVTNSHDVTINQTFNNYKDALQLISNLKDEVDKHDISTDLKEDIIDCATEIESKVKATSPVKRHLLNNLIDLTKASEISTIVALGIQIVQLLTQ